MGLLRKVRIVFVICLVFSLMIIAFRCMHTFNISVVPVIRKGTELDQKQKESRENHVNSSPKREASLGATEDLNLNKSSERSAQAPPPSIQSDVLDKHVTSKTATTKPELHLVKETALDKNSSSPQSTNDYEPTALVKETVLGKNTSPKSTNESEPTTPVKETVLGKNTSPKSTNESEPTTLVTETVLDKNTSPKSTNDSEPTALVKETVADKNTSPKSTNESEPTTLVTETVLDKNTSPKSTNDSEPTTLVKQTVADKNRSPKSTNESEPTLSVKLAASTAKSIPKLTTSTVTVKSRNISEQAPVATTAAPAKIPKFEREFLENVKHFLEELPQNSTYSEALANVIKRATSRKPGWETNDTESLHDSQFLNYMKCPTSVRKKMITNKLFAKSFIPEVPILAWNEHYTPDEYNRLKEYIHVNGWNGVDQSMIASALQRIDTLRNKYLFDNRMVNGSIPNDHKCIRCAVVGNGGILNGSKMGKEIDANDYVFRVNTGVTNGYEEDVGTRTSFYCFGIITLRATVRKGWQHGFKVPTDKDIRYVFFADSQLAYSYLSDVLNDRKPQKSIAMQPPMKTVPANMKLVHPDFQRYIKFSWVKSPRSRREVYRPTTGGIMLLLALHTCDEVNVYGYGGSYEKFSEHYYDRAFEKHKNYANHDTTAENNLWKELHREGLINMYTRE